MSVGTPHRSPSLLLLALGGLLWLPLAATAQIASPIPAGSNAGNNSTGSSGSPISTPNFATVQTVATVPGVTVAADGTINADPTVIASVNAALIAAVGTPEGSLLAAVLGATPPAVSATDLVNPDQTPELVLASGAGQSTHTYLSLVDEVAAEFAAGTIGTEFSVTNLATGNTGTVVLAEGAIVVNVSGGEVVFSVTEQTVLALSQFAAIGIAAGLSVEGMNAGLEITAAGASPIQVAQLMVSLQGLASATTLTPLSNGINAFNAILTSTPDAGISALATNSTFLAARAVLIAGRNGLLA